MDDRALQRARRRFYAMLGLFALWVAALGALAVVSSFRPAPSPPAGAGR